MKLSVIVPTWNNANLLTAMVNSMTRIGFFKHNDRELIIVNNGKQPCEKDYAHIKNLSVVTCEDNRGWEGGLVEGLKVAKGDYVCFQNDDVHIPQNQDDFYGELMDSFNDDTGMVAPISTTCAGIQSVFHNRTPSELTEVKWIIFLCVMMKRSVLDAVGGVDETLPGGDDIDLSMRMRIAGYKLYVNPKAFIIHHAFQTGVRVHGDSDKEGGWNSEKMQENTNRALIIKHGFIKWAATIQGQHL